MTNEEKAAIMLLSLDEAQADLVMKNLRPAEVRRIGKYMNKINTIPEDTLRTVAREFITLAKEGGGTIAVGEGVAKNIVRKAIGEKEANVLMTEEASDSGENPIVERLRDVDPRVLLEFTKAEHPQTIALILVHLQPVQAAEIVESFSMEMQGEIIRRMATLKTVPREFIDEIAKTLEKEIVVGAISEHQVGGVQIVSEILNVMNRANENEIMASLDEKDPNVASQIRALMFTFEDVLKLEDRSLQELLKEVSSEDLSKALKAVDEGQRQKFYKNMSRRGAEMLKEDIEMMPPIRLSEVETTQRSIVETAKRLEGEGRITALRGTQGDEYV
ncbi:MAG: flagellar motor switch protein FliG [Deltaproteobacteria bacterium]|nr:flagellar motor switch protein FliG [Deltaproteobacteria bacterium]